MRTVPALVIAALWVASAAYAQDEKKSSGHSTVSIDGKTIEVVGGTSSVSSSNGRVSIKSGDHEVVIEDGKIVVGGESHDLGDFTKLTLTVEDGGIKVNVDGKDLSDLIKWANRLGEIGGEEDKGAPPTEDKFPAEKVKSVSLQGLSKKFAVEADAEAKEVVVRRKGKAGEVEQLTVTLKDGTLSVSAKEDATSQARVSVVVPPGTALQVLGCRNGIIGDLGGDLTLETLGSDNIKVGKVHGATVKVAGSGDVDIASVDGGDLALEVMGSGDILVRGGTAHFGKLSVLGSGDIVCRAKIGKASAGVMGSGDIKLVEPGEFVEKSILGSGDIEVLGK